jgi:hypothetical protein
MILFYTQKTLKIQPKKPLDLIKTFSNTFRKKGYKNNIQKSIAFLYTNNAEVEKENNPIYNRLKNYFRR